MKLSGTSTLAGCAALALLLSACVATEPAYPVRAPAPPPAPAPAPPPPPPPPEPAPVPRDPDAPSPAPTSPIRSTPLPPIGSAPAGPKPSQPPAGLATTASRPAAASRPAPPASPWVQPAAAGATQGVAVVGRGETVYEVAERVRTPVRALIEANNLKPPYTVAPGARLKVPPPLFYVIAEGDTLYGVARRFAIEPRSLASLNNIALETPIRPGQVLALPALAKDRGATPQANGPSPVEPAPAPPARVAAVPPRPAAPTAPAPPAVEPAPAVVPAPTPSPEVQAAIAGRGRFTWPVQGEILSTFGSKGQGQRNDGLNIAAASGDAVHASAGGEVVFAGELPSFGNLVLLKHQGGFVTAYAHLSKIAVKMREQVTQGQSVGLAGQTGLVDRPQVHFEIRYAANPRDKAAPVDPSMLLPGAG